MKGFVNVYKPKGMTSFQVVAKLKKIYQTKKVGHLGTLDPMAEGVLPIAIGKATKFFDYFLLKQKEYDAIFRAGVLTDTLDADGQILNENNFIPTIEQVQKASINFVGKISQMPPKFSAKKINGIRAYKLAREGKDFDLKPKEVEICHILASKGDDDSLFNLKIMCSSGTYIRSLGVDIFASINALATMVKLVRTRAGQFKIENSLSLEEIENMPQSAIAKIDEVIILPKIELNEEQFFKLKNGVAINYLGADAEYWVIYKNKVLGLGTVKDNVLKIKINTMEEE